MSNLKGDVISCIPDNAFNYWDDDFVQSLQTPYLVLQNFDSHLLFFILFSIKEFLLFYCVLFCFGEKKPLFFRHLSSVNVLKHWLSKSKSC